MPKSEEAITLSRRESDVLLGFARGFLDKEIAISLGVSIATVRTYRKRVHRKLGTRGFVQPLLVAWKLGLLDIEPIAEEGLAKRACK